MSHEAEFGRRFKEVFGNASNKQIAQLLGVTPPAVQNYKRGRVPPFDILLKIVEVTNCDLHWLLTGVEKATRATRDISSGKDEPSLDLINHKNLEKFIRNIVKDEIRSKNDIRTIKDLGEIDDYTIEHAIEMHDAPQSVIEEIITQHGWDLGDVGILYFSGWESFTTEEKKTAIKDAINVLQNKFFKGKS